MSISKGEPDYREEKPIYKKGKRELSIRDLQQRIRSNKAKQGFNLNDPWMDFAYLVGEFGELAEGIKNSEREDVIESVVDMFVFALGLFEMYEVDGYEFLIKKMIINENRRYKKSSTDYWVRKNREEKEKISDIIIPENHELHTFGKLQKRAYKNKKNKGFNVNALKIEEEYVNLGEEISELFVGLRRGKDEEFLDALTDVCIYLLGLFEMYKLNGYEYITKKMTLNEKRYYMKTGQGTFLREDQM